MIWIDAQRNRYVTDHKISSDDWVDSIIHMHTVYLYEEYMFHGIEHLCNVLCKYETYTGNFFKESMCEPAFPIWDRKSVLYGSKVSLQESDRLYLAAMEICYAG